MLSCAAQVQLRMLRGCIIARARLRNVARRASAWPQVVLCTLALHAVLAARLFGCACARSVAPTLAP
eukprot:13755339-Alexandrium_andersonii.AAC.1